MSFVLWLFSLSFVVLCCVLHFFFFSFLFCFVLRFLLSRWRHRNSSMYLYPWFSMCLHRYLYLSCALEFVLLCKYIFIYELCFIFIYCFPLIARSWSWRQSPIDGIKWKTYYSFINFYISYLCKCQRDAHSLLVNYYCFAFEIFIPLDRMKFA